MPIALSQTLSTMDNAASTAHPAAALAWRSASGGWRGTTLPSVRAPKTAPTPTADMRKPRPWAFWPSTFVAISEVGSFTKVAHLFGLTQPAVSSHMRRLESMVGADLLQKSLSGITVTDYGVEVLRQARRILAINDQIVGGVGLPAVHEHRVDPPLGGGGLIAEELGPSHAGRGRRGGLWHPCSS